MLRCTQATKTAEQMTIAALMPSANAEQPIALHAEPPVREVERSAINDDTPVSKKVRAHLTAMHTVQAPHAVRTHTMAWARRCSGVPLPQAATPPVPNRTRILTDTPRRRRRPISQACSSRAGKHTVPRTGEDETAVTTTAVRVCPLRDPTLAHPVGPHRHAPPLCSDGSHHRANGLHAPHPPTLASPPPSLCAQAKTAAGVDKACTQTRHPVRACRPVSGCAGRASAIPNSFRASATCALACRDRRTAC